MNIINPKTIKEAVTQTLSRNASVYDADGLLTASGIIVTHTTEPSSSDLDSVYNIGGTQHVATDVEHNEEANELGGLAGGWTVEL